MTIHDFFENFDFYFEDQDVKIFEGASVIGIFGSPNELKEFISKEGNKNIVKWGIESHGFFDDFPELTIVIGKA